MQVVNRWPEPSAHEWVGGVGGDGVARSRRASRIRVEGREVGGGGDEVAGTSAFREGGVGGNDVAQSQRTFAR
jgi:hypothetical protein